MEIKKKNSRKPRSTLSTTVWGHEQILFTVHRPAQTRTHQLSNCTETIHPLHRKRSFKQLCLHILCRCEPPENTVTHNCMWCYSLCVRYPERNKLCNEMKNKQEKSNQEERKVCFTFTEQQRKSTLLFEIIAADVCLQLLSSRRRKHRMRWKESSGLRKAVALVFGFVGCCRRRNGSVSLSAYLGHPSRGSGWDTKEVQRTQRKRAFKNSLHVSVFASIRCDFLH